MYRILFAERFDVEVVTICFVDDKEVGEQIVNDMVQGNHQETFAMVDELHPKQHPNLYRWVVTYRVGEWSARIMRFVTLDSDTTIVMVDTEDDYVIHVNAPNAATAIEIGRTIKNRS